MEAVTDSVPPPSDRQREQAGGEPVVTLGANYTTLGDVVVAPLSFGGVIAVLIGGPACVIVVAIGRRVYRRRQPLAAVRQERRELVRALGKLAGAGDFYIQLADILQSYLRLTFKLPPGEISAEALADAFESTRLSDQLRDEARGLLDACDAGRFASGAVTDEEKARLTARARELFRELERSAK